MDDPETMTLDLARREAAAKTSLDADAAAELGKLSDGWGARIDVAHDQAATLRSLTRSLVEAGFMLHDCAGRQYTGGVCLTPSVSENGVIVTWTVHDALSCDACRISVDASVHKVMNDAVADVLRSQGWHVDAFGCAGAHIARPTAAVPGGAS